MTKKLRLAEAKERLKKKKTEWRELTKKSKITNFKPSL
jgi:hypothetical protein